MSDEEYDDDFIDGLDLQAPLRPLAVCQRCGMGFPVPKPFEAGVHDYCSNCYRELREGRNAKLPLGPMRKSIYEHARALNLLGAIRRYMDVNKEIPEEWIQELRTLPPAKAGGKMELETQVRLYNSSWRSIDAKKIGIRVVRFKEKEDDSSKR